MIGRFILGAIFGGVVVTGGLVIGAAFFPPGGDGIAANANAGPEASAAVEAPAPVEVPTAPEVSEPAQVVEVAPSAPAPVEAQAATPAPEAPAEPAPAPAETAVTDPAVTSPAADETDALAEPIAEGSPASDPAPQALPQPTLAEPEPEAPALAADNPADTPAPAAIAEVPVPDQPADPAQPPAPEADAAVAGVETEPPAPPSPAEPAPAALAEADSTPPPEPATEAPAPDLAEAEAGIEIAEALPEPQPPSAETPIEPELTDDPAPADPAPEMAPEAEAPRLPGNLASDMPGSRPSGLPGSDPAPDSAGAGDATAQGAGNGTPGVIVGRLPRIGDAPAAEESAPDASAEAPPADDRPIAQFATPFENPDNKPLVAILLIDSGAEDLDRAGLAALPFPVSFALDPLDPATAERAATYRAGGKEVVMLATGLPEGAQPSDVEVAFQSMAQNLPEAVAVMDLPMPVFQNNRPLASLVVPVVQAQGRGLVTWDAGLNAADQVARREDLAATTIFRDLASGGTDRFAIRRTLERVVFKAGQDGRVAVATEATPEMVAALLEWSIEGRSATVALAPVTAVLTVE